MIKKLYIKFYRWFLHEKEYKDYIKLCKENGYTEDIL